MQDHRIDPVDAIARLEAINLNDLGASLSQIAGLAKLTIPRVADASVTLGRRSGAHTAASTGDLALALDQGQYERGHGPCLEASTTATAVLVPDMNREQRWSDWPSRAVEAGAGSALSVGWPLHRPATGSLNLYATQACSFDDDTIVLAQVFSSYAAVALANAHLRDAMASVAAHARTAFGSHAAIERAKRIVMESRRCTAQQAIWFLDYVAHNNNPAVHGARPY